MPLQTGLMHRIAAEIPFARRTVLFKKNGSPVS